MTFKKEVQKIKDQVEDLQERYPQQKYDYDFSKVIIFLESLAKIEDQCEHDWKAVDKKTYKGELYDGWSIPAVICSLCKTPAWNSPHGYMARPYNGN